MVVASALIQPEHEQREHSTPSSLRADDSGGRCRQCELGENGLQTRLAVHGLAVWRDLANSTPELSRPRALGHSQLTTHHPRSRLKHKNIVQLFDTYEDRERVYLVMQL